MYFDRLIPLFILVLTIPSAVLAENAEQEKFFETQMRPLLAQHCFECHSDKKKQGDLRLDRKKYVFGESPVGIPVVPGKLNDSRLWQVVQFDEFDTQMPPSGKLPPEKLQILKTWIESGAYWPEETESEETGESGGIPYKSDGSIDYQQAIASHWAYQPVTEPEIPAAATDQLTTAIDKFLAAKQSEKGLSFSPQTSRQHLLRRLSYDLRGLPPSIEEVEAFEQDESPEAFEKRVNQYLADPAYGERWGRYWLDIARYADTKGYVFTSNRFYPYSYTYRDYVIQSINEDKPYDTFLMEQLAADKLGYAENDPRLAALGFLTIGPRFLNRTPDIIDDRIDVVTRGLMGMTLACARCHDHKFDPLPTADYYSLYGVFDSCYEPDLPPLHGEVDRSTPEFKKFSEELVKREQKLDDYVQKAHAELVEQVRNQLDDYFPAALKSIGWIPEEQDLPPKHGDRRDKLTAHWKKTLQLSLKSNHPVLLPARKLLTLKDDELANQQSQILDQLSSRDDVPKFLIEALRETKSRMEIVDAYVGILTSVRDEWTEKLKANPEATQLDDPEREAIRNLLFGQGSISDVAVSGESSPLFERDNHTKIRNLKKEIEEWHSTSPDAPARSMVLFDKENLVTPVIFVRGNVGRRGDKVPRRGPQILDPSPEAIFKESSGRKALAEQIVSKQNPLTARVIANRIWMYHFGAPLVDTPGDFGLRTAPPLQRQLLDYLAWSLMHQHNWSQKGLHREILLTQAWQQQSLDRPEARKIDPENMYFWRQNRQRLDFEAMRDSMLSVAGKLNQTVGGKAVDIEKHPFPERRTVYAFIDRNNPSGLLRTFDYPTPNSSSPARSETTVPQQALFGMNSAFATEMATSLASRVARDASTPEDQARKIIRLAFARTPSEDEVLKLKEYLAHGSLEELAQALLISNEFFFVD